MSAADSGPPRPGARPPAPGNALPADDVPVLTEVVAVPPEAQRVRSAEADALTAQIERAVLEELTPRLEEAVHEAVRAAVDRAFAARQAKDPTP
jgi:hypothetical protein